MVVVPRRGARRKKRVVVFHTGCAGIEPAYTHRFTLMRHDGPLLARYPEVASVPDHGAAWSAFSSRPVVRPIPWAERPPAVGGAGASGGFVGQIDVDFGKFGNRSKGMSVGLALLGVALFLVDFVVLRGEHVASDSISLASREPALLRLDRIGEEHLVEVDTRRRVHRKQRGRAIKFRFEDPEGRLVYQASEIVAHKERCFSFTPTTAGEYRLYVEPNNLLGGSSSGSARADVYVNDHRILGRLFSFVSF